MCVLTRLLRLHLCRHARLLRLCARLLRRHRLCLRPRLLLPRRANRLASEAFYRTLEVRIAMARLRLPLDTARFEGALDLLRVGQRRPERRAIVRVADALQPGEVAACVRLEAWVVLLQKVNEDAQRGRS